MKFKNYINDFRNLEIGLVDKPTSHKQLVRQIKEEFNVDKDVVNAIDDLNRLLRRRVKFDLVMGESVNSKMIEKKFKIKKKMMDKLKIKLLESGDMLAGMKREVENKLLQSDGPTHGTGKSNPYKYTG